MSDSPVEPDEGPQPDAAPPRPTSYRTAWRDPRLAPLWYTLARLGLLVAAGAVAYLFGARGFLLLILAFLISGIAAVPLLRNQRGMISAGIVHLSAKINKRFDDAAASEDDD